MASRLHSVMGVNSLAVGIPGFSKRWLKQGAGQMMQRRKLPW